MTAYSGILLWTYSSAKAIFNATLNIAVLHFHDIKLLA